MAKYSHWYYHLYLITAFAFAGVALGYSAMMGWVFGPSFFENTYTAGFALIAALSGIMLIWNAGALLHFFRYPNPTIKMARAFTVGTLTIHIAIVIISIVMLAILGAERMMAFYVVLIIWAAVNGVLAVLALVWSPNSTHVERPPQQQNFPNVTVRSEEVVFARQTS